uniref:Uncharacterized protein n=1 Tax=Hemipteran tombus-related virus TaxID=2822554 RepID=A0A8A6RHU1_9TOMB|nr:hypothetical protein [Hemipteran tombus-related virus]
MNENFPRYYYSAQQPWMRSEDFAIPYFPRMTPRGRRGAGRRRPPPPSHPEPREESQLPTAVVNPPATAPPPPSMKNKGIQVNHITVKKSTNDWKEAFANIKGCQATVKTSTQATQTEVVAISKSDELIKCMVNMLCTSPAPDAPPGASKIDNHPRNENKGKKYDDCGGIKNKKSTAANDHADKPTFEMVEKVAVKKNQMMHEGVLRYFVGKLMGRKTELVIDEDLLAYLQLEAAFLPRSSALARSLINSARRFFTYYDALTISWMQKTEIIISTVAVAMCVGDLERKAVDFFTWKRPLEINSEVKQNFSKLTSGIV